MKSKKKINNENHLALQVTPQATYKKFLENLFRKIKILLKEIVMKIIASQGFYYKAELVKITESNNFTQFFLSCLRI